jgi:hypothetical protein
MAFITPFGRGGSKQVTTPPFFPPGQHEWSEIALITAFCIQTFPIEKINFFD